MKIRIITGRGWYMSYINNVFDVDKEKENGYLVTSIGGWRGTVHKEDAEVAEEEKKNCTTCKFDPNGCNLMGVECDNFKKWQPIESVEKKDVYGFTKTQVEEMKTGATEDAKHCTTCLYNVDKPADKCYPNCANNHHKNWKPQDEIVTNENGGRQSKSEYLWTDFNPNVLLELAKLSHAGCEKYGVGNWKRISRVDHLQHSLTHIFKYLAGDRKENHLLHSAWRILSAIGVEEKEKPVN